MASACSRIRHSVALLLVFVLLGGPTRAWAEAGSPSEELPPASEGSAEAAPTAEAAGEVAQVDDAGYAALTTQAQLDARSDMTSQDKLVWGGAGCLFNFAGVLAAIAFTPEVPPARLVGKSAEQAVIYSAAYEKAVEKERTKSAAIGWVVGTASSAVLYFGAAAAVVSSASH